jgi:hypothetical protein
MDLKSNVSPRLGYKRSWEGPTKTTSTAFIDTPKFISTLTSFPRDQRYVCAFVTGVIKSLAADFESQTSSKNRRQPRLRRHIGPNRGRLFALNPSYYSIFD